jgi:TPP-dependent pyruvate/acetoin dehydrogenase alpha subunit
MKIKNISIYEKLFYEALRIRLVEEKIIQLYPFDKIQSPVHLSIGQEAVAVGLCANLNSEDWIFINYRGHAFYLAKGGPLPELFAELYGKKTGLSKGKAGSMHLAAPQYGVMGASAVVGSTISHAIGAALASKIRGEDRVFTAIFGDGATEQGAYHESLNFASLYSLPVLFLCENNGLAVHAAVSERQSYSLAHHALAYGIDSTVIEEGFDFVKISNTCKKIVDQIRGSRKPMLLEVKTCRYREHVGPGEDFHFGYRSLQAIESWKAKDPLELDKTLYAKFAPQINIEINKAVEFAESSPFPTVDDLLTDVI